ncbi:hypothetical protein K7432_012508 [Basidiobolus ranarum]|uniref:RING-type domain-containing protein n=1 Tax=Basidiobolus ranarum TaxID=34480 RepID=A0ABR2VS66_9FUNG
MLLTKAFLLRSLRFLVFIAFCALAQCQNTNTDTNVTKRVTEVGSSEQPELTPPAKPQGSSTFDLGLFLLYGGLGLACGLSIFGAIYYIIKIRRVLAQTRAHPIPEPLHTRSTLKSHDLNGLVIVSYSINDKPQLSTIHFESDMCAVCLNDYEDSDQLRTLPCLHQFHRACIDPWLLSRSSLCPICKRDCAPVENRAKTMRKSWYDELYIYL